MHIDFTMPERMAQTSPCPFCVESPAIVFFLSLSNIFIAFKGKVFDSKLETHYRNVFVSLLSCPVLTSEQTLSVLRNGQGPEAMFRIQMFKFVGSSYTNVFLHCNVQICHNGPGLCQPVSELVLRPFLKPVVRGQFRQVAFYM